MGLSKIRKQFLNFNFFGGHFVTKTSLLFLNQHKILNFYTLYDLFQEKNYHLSEGTILKFIHTKTEKR
jgi:hypothetical protein